MDEIAKIYIEEYGNVWRIKVFPKSIGVERQQPQHDDNLLFDKSEFPNLYNEGLNAWNIQVIDALISHYEATVADINAKLDAEDN
jgi:hypothetical protein